MSNEHRWERNKNGDNSGFTTDQLPPWHVRAHRRLQRLIIVAVGKGRIQPNEITPDVLDIMTNNETMKILTSKYKGEELRQKIREELARRVSLE